MPREITQRLLRNQSGEIMRGLDSGESYIVTRNGVAVGELAPLRRPRFTSREAVVRAFAGSAPIDSQRWREDLDQILDQDPDPRG